MEFDPRAVARAGQPVQFAADQFTKLLLTLRIPPSVPRLLTDSAAARELGVDRKTVRDMLRARRVPPVVMAAHRSLIDRRDLNRVIESRKARTAEALPAMTDRRRTSDSLARYAARQQGLNAR